MYNPLITHLVILETYKDRLRETERDRLTRLLSKSQPLPAGLYPAPDCSGSNKINHPGNGKF